MVESFKKQVFPPNFMGETSPGKAIWGRPQRFTWGTGAKRGYKTGKLTHISMWGFFTPFWGALSLLNWGGKKTQKGVYLGAKRE